MHHSQRRLGVILGVVLGVMIVIRIVTPYVMLSYTNHVLANLGDYAGHVDDIHLALWRGAYSVEGISVSARKGESKEPLFSCPRIDLSVPWGPLLRGKLLAGVAVNEPRVSLVAAPAGAEEKKEKLSKAEQAQKLTAETRKWQGQVKSLLPFKVDHVTVRDAAVYFHDYQSDPPLNLFMTDIDGSLENLTNSRKVSSDLTASAHFHGRVMHSGNVQIDADIYPYSPKPTFDLSAKLQELRLTDLNDFLRAYADVDAEGGQFSAYTEVKSKDGHFDGYVKPFLEDARFLDWKHEHEGVLQKAWEGLVQAATNVFENEQTDRVASEIPLHGEFISPNPDIWTSVMLLLRNAFIEALREGLDSNMKTHH